MKAFEIDRRDNPRRDSLEFETLLSMRIMDGVEEVGDCWLWQRGTTPHGYPIMKIAGFGCCHVRRVVATLVGHQLATREPVETTCNERCCLNPAHLRPSNSRQIAKSAAKRGAFSSLTRRIKIAKNRRMANGVKIDIEKAREIRASSESGPVLAKRYGIAKSAINRIKRGEAWIEYQDNPFAGLFAVNDQNNKRS